MLGGLARAQKLHQQRSGAVTDDKITELENRIAELESVIVYKRETVAVPGKAEGDGDNSYLTYSFESATVTVNDVLEAIIKHLDLRVSYQPQKISPAKVEVTEKSKGTSRRRK